MPFCIRMPFHRIRQLDEVKVRTPSTSTAERNWARIVAIAAPAMPHWNFATKSRSSPVFTPAEKSRK